MKGNFECERRILAKLSAAVVRKGDKLFTSRIVFTQNALKRTIKSEIYDGPGKVSLRLLDNSIIS